MIGEGAQGQVWLCRDAQDQSKEVVEKVMKFAGRADRDAAMELALAVRRLRHQHLIPYLDVMAGEEYDPTNRGNVVPTVTVLMPYFVERDMKSLIETLEHPLGEYDICSMVLQLASVIGYLHEQSPPIVHGDVKPDNVLMFDGLKRVLLMDLDTSRRAAPNGAAGAAMTYEYAAPERCTTHPVLSAGLECRADVFSLGVVFFSLLFLPEFVLLRHPTSKEQLTLHALEWTPTSMRLAIEELRMSQRVECGAGFRPWHEMTIELLCAMLKHDPRERPDAHMVAAMLNEIMLELLTR